MIQYLIHQLCYKNSSGSFYHDLTGMSTLIGFTIYFILEACSGHHSCNVVTESDPNVPLTLNTLSI